MSKRRLPRARSAPCSARGPTLDSATDPEAIALRIHQIAATAAVLAEAAALPDSHGEQLSHALYLIEETLLEV